MAANKTVATDADVNAFLGSVEPERRRNEVIRLDKLFREVTGFQPRMWGESIVGYGRYHYVYASGREGDHLATGFSPRKTALTLYIMPGYANFGALLEKLGPHKLGRSCLYINRLEKVDERVLAEIIRAGLKDLNAIWPVQPE